MTVRSLVESTTGSFASAAMSDLTATCADTGLALAPASAANDIAATATRLGDFMRKSGSPGKHLPRWLHHYDCLSRCLVTDRAAGDRGGRRKIMLIAPSQQKKCFSSRKKHKIGRASCRERV